MLVARKKRPGMVSHIPNIVNLKSLLTEDNLLFT